MTKTRWNYEKVNDYIIENSDCQLLSTEFKTAKTKLYFKCKCGNEFETTFERFRLRDKRQCNDCGFNNQLMNQSLSLEEVRSYVEEFSNCTLLSDIYINTKTKLKFKCQCGSIFHKTFEKFKNKSKTCKKCSYDFISKSQTFDYEFVKEYIDSMGCELKSKNYNSCEDKLNIMCKCSRLYKTDFNSFKNSNQIRCRVCTNSISKGELIISNFLDSNHIEYETQFTFDDLKALNGKHKLMFDFAIFENKELKYLIEFDGKQHDSPVDFFGGLEAYQVLKFNDTLKNNYCKENNIELIRIPYKQLKNINNILNNSLNINHDNTVPRLVI